MAPKNSLAGKSKASRDGRASMKLTLSKRRSTLWQAGLRRMIRDEMKIIAMQLHKKLEKLLHKMEKLGKQLHKMKKRGKQWHKMKEYVQENRHAVHSFPRLMSTSGSLPNQPDSSGQSKLHLHFDCELPSKVFTTNVLYAIGTQANQPVRVVLLDENNNIIKEGPLSLLKIEICVVHGDFKAEYYEDWTEEEIKIVDKREKKGSLLDGTCVSTMESGVCSFNDINFADNSSWVPSKKFRLGAKVAESVPRPVNVEIRPAVSGAFQVKDQRGKAYEKHNIPSWDDEVWRLKKIAKDGIYHRSLEKKGIRTVQDFLRNYHMDQSSLQKILDAKGKRWETIVEHAILCSLNNECFRYDSEIGVELLFNCVYKLVSVSFDRQNGRFLDTLNEHEKYQVENLRRSALEDPSRLVTINFPGGWPSAKISPCTNPQDPSNMQKMVLVEQLKQYIYHNPNVLNLTNGSSSIHLSMPSQFQKNDPVCGPSFDPWGNGVPITDQGNMLDLSHSDTSRSNLHASCQLEEDIAACSGQPFEAFEGPSWGSSSQLGYEWDPIMDEFFPWATFLQPATTTWATPSGSNAQPSSTLHTFGINLSGSGKSKARWGKIRALLTWKIVKRDATAKKKGKFLASGYHRQQRVYDL